MIPKLTSLFVIASLFTITTFISCKKDNSTISDAQQEAQFAQISSESDAEAEVIFEDVFDNVMGVNAEVGLGETGVFGFKTTTTNGLLRVDSSSPVKPCFLVSVTLLNTPARFPVKIVIDFGATGCVGADGRVRKGKIITVYTGPLTKPGSVAETSFDGYYVNNVKVEGTHRIENQSTANTWVYQVKVTNAKLTFLNGNFSQWNRTKLITQIEGLGTPLWPRDDAFSIRGEANGAVKRDTLFFQWSTRTAEPLIKKFTCPWIVKGVVAIRRSNSDVALLNYGNGVCDSLATITVNSVTKQIILR
jgi:hypothetical protein